MKKLPLLTATTGLLAGATFLTVFTGCDTDDTSRRGRYRDRDRANVHGQVAVVSYEDDYDYYPGYEVYYSRNRREYVYRDGSQWVRRREPSGISLDLLLSTPSVRVDFRDSPERHHDSVVRRYPRNWKRQDERGDRRRDDYDERRDGRRLYRPGLWVTSVPGWR